MAAEWPGRTVLVTRFEIFDERSSAADCRPQIFCVAGHFVQAQVRVSIFANNMRFNEALAVLAPTCVRARAGICRRIRHAAPQIILWRKSVLEFVVHKILQKFQRVRIARVRVKPLQKALHHCAQITGRIHPVFIRNHFKRCAIEIEAAIEVGQTLPIGSFTVEVTRNGCWAFNGGVTSTSKAAGMIARLKLFIGDRREN